MNNNTENENFKLAREVSTKFEFYFIALVFTILGLSIQTSTFTTKCYQYVFEISSWVMLLISGLTGLSRMSWMGPFYAQSGTIQKINQRIEMFEGGLKVGPIFKPSREAWTDEEIEKELPDLKKALKVREQEKDKIAKSTFIKYQVHKWAFVIGIVLLIISRSISELQKLFP